MEQITCTAKAKTILQEPENFFPDYPPLAMEFFKLLLERLPDTTTPLDFAMRFEEALHDVRSQPTTFGHTGIFISTMRMTIGQIAEKLFDKAFGETVDAHIQEAYESSQE